jgi:hypothetical protein
MRSFLTGSRVYGTPREDSDIDLVIQLPIDDQNKLIEIGDEAGIQLDDEYPQVRFGKLQIIMVTTDWEFAAWKHATQNLIKQAPVTREKAIETIKEALGKS